MARLLPAVMGVGLALSCYSQVAHKTVLNLDKQFDGGSGIVLDELTNAQVENLAVLGKVWGFLKYHHPRITAGERHWDYELFRVLPAILAAADRTAANSALNKWIVSLGAIEPCNPCAKLDGEVHLRPELEWIADEILLGTELSQNLTAIHPQSPGPGPQAAASSR